MLIFACLTLLIFTLAFPTQCAYYTSNALKMCINATVPSLFLPIVVSKIISKKTKSIPLSKYCENLSSCLCISAHLVPICFLGLIFGAPSGAVGVCEIYSSGLCSKEEAERALIISSGCSFSFILSFVATVLGSRERAVIILVSNLFTTFIVYFLFFTKHEKIKSINANQISPKNAKDDFLKLITSSVSEGIQTVLNLCSYVLFFNVLSEIALKIIFFFFSPPLIASTTISCLVRIFFEICSGTVATSVFYGNAQTAFCAISVAFCGLSIILQTVQIAKKANLDYKNFVFSKIISAFLCPLITILLLFLFPDGKLLSIFSKASHSLKYPILILAFYMVFIKVLPSLIKSTKRNKQK